MSSACAPIDSQSSITVRPQPEATLVQLGGEELLVRDFQADYVQLGGQLLLEIRELPRCVLPRHRPVTRVETIDRSARGFVAWDFALAGLTGGFATLAFARPRFFATRLINDQGQFVYDYTSAWVTGGIFAGVGAILLAAGVVNAVKVRDSIHYADAYQVEPGPPHPCPGGELPAADRRLRLQLEAQELVIEGHSDAGGRARFSLPPWKGPAPEALRTPAVIELGLREGDGWEPQVLVLQLQVPWEGMIDAHTGRADSRETLGDRGPQLELGSPPEAATKADSPPEGPAPLDLGPDPQEAQR